MLKRFQEESTVLVTLLAFIFGPFLALVAIAGCFWLLSKALPFP